MLAHTGEFPRFAESSPRLNQSMWQWIAFALVSIVGVVALVSRIDVAPTMSAYVAPGTVLSFTRRPSHERRYFAEVVATSGTLAVGGAHTWDVEIRRRNHRRLSHATVTARLWMPATGETRSTTLQATYVGHSRYRLSGLVLDRPGWWNVDLAIQGIAGRDSVAFNLILPP